MSMALYDPKNHTFSLLGVIITGFADGEFIKASRKEDSFSVVVGAQGDRTRVQNRNVSGMFEFSLQRTADVNNILYAMVAADEAGAQLVGTAQLVDNATQIDTAHSSDAFIVRPADTALAKDLPTIKWQVLCGGLEFGQGAQTAI
jgi:hypothetical protein